MRPRSVSLAVFPAILIILFFILLSPVTQQAMLVKNLLCMEQYSILLWQQEYYVLSVLTSLLKVDSASPSQDYPQQSS